MLTINGLPASISNGSRYLSVYILDGAICFDFEHDTGDLDVEVSLVLINTVMTSLIDAEKEKVLAHKLCEAYKATASTFCDELIVEILDGAVTFNFCFLTGSHTASYDIDKLWSLGRLIHHELQS